MNIKLHLSLSYVRGMSSVHRRVAGCLRLVAAVTLRSEHYARFTMFVPPPPPLATKPWT